MTGDSNFSSSGGKAPDQGRRKRVILMFIIANLTVAFMLAVLSRQPGITTPFIVLFAVVILLIGNGALWLGLRPSTAKLTRRPGWWFGVAGFAFIDAILDVTDQKYSLAFTPASIGIILIVFGLRAMRTNAKKNAERQDPAELSGQERR